MIKFKLFGYGGSKETKTGNSSQEMPACIEDAPVNPNAKRVLIVDDDPVFLTATAMKLQSAGFHVRTAKEGPEAIAALNDQPADAILMDIDFPPDVASGGTGTWDGFRLITWLRGQPGAKGARFFMVSISDSDADRRRALQTGAVAYFQKPLDHDKVIAAVNAAN